MVDKKTPFGQNQLDSKTLFKERQHYAENWLPPSEASNLIDFWNDPTMRKYGMVNLLNQTIRVNSRFLKKLPGKIDLPDNHAVNFVVDAFEDLKKYMDASGPTARGAAALDEHSKYFDLQVSIQNSWESINKSYERHLRDIFEHFTEKYLQVPHYKKQVYTIEDFAKMFLQAARDVGGTTPLTKTAFAENIKSPMNFNGLNIEITTKPGRKNDHSNDYKKTFWIDDSGFKFWLRACRLHGFWVDRNAPWKIVANLNSLKMKKYMAKYKIYSLQELFDVYYTPTHLDDIAELKNYMFQFWKAFLRFEPEIEVPHYSLGHQATEVKKRTRVDISESSYKLSHGDLYWMQYWFDMRCYEMGITIKPTERQKIFRTATKIKKELDILSATDYIISILLKKDGQMHNPERSFIHRKTHRQVLKRP